MIICMIVLAEYHCLQRWFSLLLGFILSLNILWIILGVIFIISNFVSKYTT